MKEVISRLKSPVVIVQLVTIIGAAVVLLLPDTSEFVDKVVSAIAIIVNVFAGLNNPTDSAHF